MSTPEVEWIVPFKGRNHSAYFEQNFLWRCGNVYVMDNHRAAMWCWLQEINPRKRHSLLHIDRHFDTLPCETFMPHLPVDLSLSADEYLNWTYPAFDDEEERLFRFDNYLSIYMKLFGRNVASREFATHRDGVKPNFKFSEIDLWKLPQRIVDPSQPPWIVNIDIDYFFCDDREEGVVQLASDEFIKETFVAVREFVERKEGVVTIAMSPEFCGGWRKSERAVAVAMKSLNLPFQLD